MKVNICAMDELPCYSKDPFLNRNDENYEEVQQPNFDCMEERSNDGGLSDNNHDPNRLELENNYERLESTILVAWMELKIKRKRRTWSNQKRDLLQKDSMELLMILETLSFQQKRL
jgi:hypothetical protein